jgi:hypothetical protein
LSCNGPPPVVQPALFNSGRANKVATTIQVTLGAWVLVGSLITSGLAWYDDGGGRSKPELYGIWNVETLTRDDKPLPPLTTQPDRWRRLRSPRTDRPRPATPVRGTRQPPSDHDTTTPHPDLLPLRRNRFNWIQEYPDIPTED